MSRAAALLAVVAGLVCHGLSTLDGVSPLLEQYGDTSSDHAYDVAATWFFRRNVGLTFAHGREQADAAGNPLHTDTTELRVVGRF